jgi:hypothetical protein
MSPELRKSILSIAIGSDALVSVEAPGAIEALKSAERAGEIFILEEIRETETRAAKVILMRVNRRM